MLGGKWKLVIINIIRTRGVIRFGQLAAAIPNISRKVLTDQLKSLEKDQSYKAKAIPTNPAKSRILLSQKNLKAFAAVFKTIEEWVNRPLEV